MYASSSRPVSVRSPASPTVPVPNNGMKPQTYKNPIDAPRSIATSLLDLSSRKLNWILKKTGKLRNAEFKFENKILQRYINHE